MKSISLGILLCLFIILAITVVIFVQENNESYIRNWAKKNSLDIVEIRREYFFLGPFHYKHKGHQIFQVTLKDNKEVWFRIDFLSHDIEWTKR